nr:alpha-xenorhabdolysin family binary toxin subunit B [Pseudomonas cichorii]
MNNVTAIDTQLNIQTPDMSIMSASLNTLNTTLVSADVLYAKTLYLSNLYERFKRINKVIVIERQRLGETSARLIIDIQSKTGVLREYDQELNETENPDDIRDIQEERANALQQTINLVRNEAGRMANVLSDMKENVNRPQTLEFLNSLEKDVIQGTARVNDITTRLTALKEERRVLSEAIDAIESKGLANIAKDTLLSAEKIAALGLQPPQTAVIALAIEQMKATLEYGAEGLTFIALIKRRDSLRERIERMLEQLAQREKEKLALVQRVELIGCFHTMDDQRSAYAEQYQKIVQTIDHFVALNKVIATDDKERSARLISSGLQLVNYLQAIR